MVLKGLSYYKVDNTVTRYSGVRDMNKIWEKPNQKMHTFVSINGGRIFNILESDLGYHDIVSLNNKICKVLYGKNS